MFHVASIDTCVLHESSAQPATTKKEKLTEMLVRGSDKP